MKYKTSQQKKVKKATHIIRAITRPREEWDFGSCPKKQYRICEIYEHARENQLVLQAVKHLRETGVWNPDPNLPVPEYCYRPLVIKMFQLFPEFPTTPFLKIPNEVREQRVQELKQLHQECACRIIKLN